MAAPYNVVLQLQLQSPTNLSSVISDIQRRLSGINASVNIQLNASSVQALAQLNQQLGALQGNLNNISSQASNAASNVNKLTAAHSAASNQVANSNAQLANSSGVMRANQIATSEASHALENFGVQAGLAARRYSAFLLAGGAIITFANELRSALGDALRFQREMVRLSQIGNETTGSLRDMESEVTRLATTWGTSSRELISATVQLRQAGLTATDTKIALDALAKSSLAPSFGSMTETAEGLIAVMNQFKVSATEAAGVLGSINAVSTQYAVSSRDIIDAVRRTGGEFRSAGGNINELIALFGAVRSTSR
jgi:chromosome segregation ATPase